MEKFWQSCLSQLESELTPQQYSAWIKPLVPLDYKDGILRVAAPNRFKLDWVKTQYADRITSLACQFLESTVDVQFMLNPGTRSAAPSKPAPSHPKPEPVMPSETAETSQRSHVSDTPTREQSRINVEMTFDSFVTGKANQLARAAAIQVANNPGVSYNPLYLFGGVGLGKTHLIHAIGNQVLADTPSAKIRYIHAEQYVRDVVTAYQRKGFDDFKRYYHSLDMLLIDDIQFLSGKDATLEQFFHTFNTLHQANKRIVIASDVPPKDLQGFNERLISRFESGLTVDVKPPDLETRIAILRMIATMNGSNIPNDVFNLIAERFTENIRELEGALNRVTAMASLSNQPVTKALAEQTLQDFFTTDVEIKPADIITQVAKYFYLTFDDIVGRSRTKKIALARQIAMYLVRELTSMSLNDIGLVFGGKDHTTVMHAYTRINDEMQEKQEIYNYVTELTLQLKQRSNDK